MTDVIVVDTNLLVLLVVGSASRTYIEKHKRLAGFSTDDFELRIELLGQFSEILLLPQILSESPVLSDKSIIRRDHEYKTHLEL